MVEAETEKIVKLEKIAATEGLGVKGAEGESDEKKCAA